MIKNLQDRFVVLIRMSRAYSQKISVIGVDSRKHARRAVQSKMLASCGSLVLILDTSFYTKKAVKGVQESGAV